MSDYALISVYGWVCMCFVCESISMSTVGIFLPVFVFGGCLQMEVLWVTASPGLVQASANCGGYGKGRRGLSPPPPAQSLKY